MSKFKNYKTYLATLNKKQMKANKNSVFLIYTFEIVNSINMPKFASINPNLCKIWSCFFSFLHFCSVIWLHTRRFFILEVFYKVIFG